jgi:hypothetical protein
VGAGGALPTRFLDKAIQQPAKSIQERSPWKLLLKLQDAHINFSDNPVQISLHNKSAGIDIFSCVSNGTLS